MKPQPTITTITLADLLFTQGFGTRRECAARIDAGQLSIDGQVRTDANARVVPQGLSFRVDGVVWRWQARALVMLNKPAGYECSRRGGAWPSVLNLLPAPLVQRGVQPVGRLDQDTTGLLLLTDDGALLHRLTSPRHHVPKVYEAELRHAFDQTLLQALTKGLMLRDCERPAAAEDAVQLGPTRLRLTLTEGRYHQVKRMVAAAGNRVEQLARVRFGALDLPADLGPGQWRWVEDAALLAPAQTQGAPPGSG